MEKGRRRRTTTTITTTIIIIIIITTTTTTKTTAAATTKGSNEFNHIIDFKFAPALHGPLKVPFQSNGDSSPPKRVGSVCLIVKALQ